MTYQYLRIEAGPAARIILDRPPVNVLTIAMLEEMASAVAEVGGLAETKVLAITGAGKAFCAGVDVADHTADRVESMIRTFSRAIQAILDVEVPTLAVVNGAALGGGMELALACDGIIARAGAKLGQPEVRLGVFAPAAAAILPRRIGYTRALDLLFTGRGVRAEEAMEMGLVNRVHSAEQLDTEVDRLLRQMTALSRPVLALTKRVAREGLERPLSGALEHADDLYLNELMQLDDSHEGLAAFMEKRAPVWSDS